jgi:hypothetical protein
MSQGVPRLYGRGSGRHRYYNAIFRELEGRFGPFDAIARSQAAATATFWAEFRSDTEALSLAEHARRLGKGRRPSAARIVQLKRRRALSWGSYEQGVRRLEELAAARPLTFADAARRAAAGGQALHTAGVGAARGER